MSERPILFSGVMVRAILAGTKSETRRVVSPQPPDYVDALHNYQLRKRAPYELQNYETGAPAGYGFEDEDRLYKCPYGRPGDRLWVRETWAVSGHYRDGPRYEYRAAPADGKHFRSVGRWRPSIHMPRAASRLSLGVTDVRLQRLQDISWQDVHREGVPDEYLAGYEDERLGFRDLWDEINAGRGFGWDGNPWVWVVQFKRLTEEP